MRNLEMVEDDGYTAVSPHSRDIELQERTSRVMDCTVDADVLRGVPACRVLWKFGDVLRDKAGTAATYRLSQRTDSIDNFLSHSWSASPAQKICALHMFFNGIPAAVASVIAAIIGLVLMQDGILPGKWCYGVGCQLHSESLLANGGCSANAYCASGNRCLANAKCCETQSFSDQNLVRHFNVT